MRNCRGTRYLVANARLYASPKAPILVTAPGPQTGRVAGRIGGGRVAFATNLGVLAAFQEGGGVGKPRHGWRTRRWGPGNEQAVQAMRQTWPRIPLGGPLATDVPPPQHFERAAQFVTEDMMARAILHGPDPEPYVQRITTYRKAGVTHLHVLQLRPDQRGFLRFYEREIAGSAPAPIHT